MIPLLANTRRYVVRSLGSLCARGVVLPLAPDFMEYRASKLKYLETETSLVLRLDCMKPQSALSHLLLPTPLIRKPFPNTYDCDTFTLTKRWCFLTGQDPSNMLLTKGVRDGIFLLLSSLSETCDQIVWPADVYPVYEKLIKKACCGSPSLVQYDTLNGLNLTALDLNSLSKNAVLLMPYPLTPLGEYLKVSDLEHLQQWLEKAPGRRIIFDCVYCYNLRSDVQHLQHLRNGQVAFTFSMAKSWASPFLEPITIGTESNTPQPRESFSRGVGFIEIADPIWRKKLYRFLVDFCMQPSHYAVAKAHWLLDKQPALPGVFNRRFRDQWSKLTKYIKTVAPDFDPPETGYFTSLSQSYVSLLESAVCAVPASVFGSGNVSTSVISCLYDIKGDDEKMDDINYWLKQSLCLDSACLAPDNAKEREMYHVTTLSNFIKGYDKYGRTYSKNDIAQSTFPDKFFILAENQIEVGVDKALKLLEKLNLAGDALLVLHTSLRPSEWIPHPRGQFVNRNWLKVTGLSILKPSSDGFEKISVEEASALSLAVNNTNLLPYNALKPRSISILPIAKGCQARCPFCFSKGSVSDDMAQKLIPSNIVTSVLEKAKSRGAERAVITGGGEPMMLPFNKLLALVAQCSIFDVVCMITNGYYLSQLDEKNRERALRQLDEHGLTVLSISRHAASDEDNEKIMYLNTESACVAKTWTRLHSQKQFSRLTRMRWVCVLQKGGVDTPEKLVEYLNFAADSGVPEVCFKELYVSTSVESLYHDAASNAWSEENQVPLSVVLEFCQKHNFQQIAALPWGAPVFEGVWNRKQLRIAAYTEPTVFWERSNGLCRSWNLMADKTVMASLEDKDSSIAYDTTSDFF